MSISLVSNLKLDPRCFIIIHKCHIFGGLLESSRRLGYRGTQNFFYQGTSNFKFFYLGGDIPDTKGYQTNFYIRMVCIPVVHSFRVDFKGALS